MLIDAKPLDTLFFKDAKPFSMGNDTWADGIFPPPPPVIYGALRSVWFAEHPAEFDKRARPDDPTLKLRIKKLHYKIDSYYFVPLPRDLAARKEDLNDDKEIKVFPLKMRNISGSASSSPLKTLLVSPCKDGEIVSSVEDSLIEIGSFCDYLMGNKCEFKAKRIKRTLEPKVGIARNNETRSSEDGKLYRVGMSRLDNLSFAIKFEGLDIHESGIIKIGGEGKAISYKPGDDDNSLNNPPNTENGLFKVYLLTPAIFNNGWIPGWLNKDTLEGPILDTSCKVRLITASLAPPLRLGGFDMKRLKPKPMRTAVGAGSVYYFECLEGNLVEAVNRLHGQPISDEESDKNQGFGICYTGRVMK